MEDGSVVMISCLDSRRVFVVRDDGIAVKAWMDVAAVRMMRGSRMSFMMITMMIAVAL